MFQLITPAMKARKLDNLKYGFDSSNGIHYSRARLDPNDQLEISQFGVEWFKVPQDMTFFHVDCRPMSYADEVWPEAELYIVNTAIVVGCAALVALAACVPYVFFYG